jgi:hypothetical protein
MSLLSNHSRSMAMPGWVALCMAVLSAAGFGLVTSGKNESSIPTLLYPYFAATSVFITTCVWILMAAGLNVPRSQMDRADFTRARTWAVRVFVCFALLLCISGLAGEPGANAVQTLNKLLFGPSVWFKECKGLANLGMPFALGSAIANALALSTFVYLGVLCNGIVLSAGRKVIGGRDPIGQSAIHLRDLSARLQRYLTLASALTVTSTLTLYLFFGVADQMQAQSAAKENPAALGPTPVAVCSPRNPPSLGFECGLPVQASKSKGTASAAYMALVCGLSFTGALFVLFAASHAAIEDRLMAVYRSAHRLKGADFSMKDFRERYGLDRAAGISPVLQTLAVGAPALTGLLTLITS